ncbi:MAG: acylglycerol kinase family protein, partial [Acidobacteria bacterium]|nr:acylglycerol kinase family protein [Acidobacteriota bacterium]
MNGAYLAVINAAAGGGRCGKLARDALARLRRAGVELEEAWTERPGQATALAADAWRDGRRHFLAVGGDGTVYEILNGVFSGGAHPTERPTLAFLPLGTGNSFLRDFTDR